MFNLVIFNMIEIMNFIKLQFKKFFPFFPLWKVVDKWLKQFGVVELHNIFKEIYNNGRINDQFIYFMC